MLIKYKRNEFNSICQVEKEELISDEAFKEAFAQKMREFRASLKMEQRELAQKLHVSPSAISLYESGKNFPRANVLKRMIDLGADVSGLFGQNERRLNALVAVQAAFNKLVGIQKSEQELFEQFKRDKEALYNEIRNIINGK